jgi:SAM-dependent methyltransferase
VDELTLAYYNNNAERLTARYNSAHTGISEFFPLAFASGMRVLDIGLGSGRDMDRLLDLGCDVFGVDPSEAMRKAAESSFPRIVGRTAQASLPVLGQPFGGAFDGVLCSAVLMHITKEEVFDACFAIREVLKDGGKLLISIPTSRPDLDLNERDEVSRLFTHIHPGYLVLLFERLGFNLIHSWIRKDSLDRSFTWSTMLFVLTATPSRPLDQIETVLIRDRKTATFKLALFRALCDISTSAFSSVTWRSDGSVGVPVDLIAENWLIYYWPLFESDIFIPQIRGESLSSKKPVSFRKALSYLASYYRSHGGLSSFILDTRQNKLSPEAKTLAINVMNQIRNAIVKGPVTYAGGALDTGKIFAYDSKRREVIVPAGIWRETSLLGYWIKDAVILRWAELTADMAAKEIKPSAVIDLLTTVPIEERDVTNARDAYNKLIQIECTWTGVRLGSRFDIDHVIPFSLWHNNDLWNLLPAHPKVNNEKREHLPSKRLLYTRRPQIIHYWDYLYSCYPQRFTYELSRMAGLEPHSAGWLSTAFAALVTAIDYTAISRGVPRWEPVSFNSPDSISDIPFVQGGA